MMRSDAHAPRPGLARRQYAQDGHGGREQPRGDQDGYGLGDPQDDGGREQADEHLALEREALRVGDEERRGHDQHGDRDDADLKGSFLSHLSPP